MTARKVRYCVDCDALLSVEANGRAMRCQPCRKAHNRKRHNKHNAKRYERDKALRERLQEAAKGRKPPP